MSIRMLPFAASLALCGALAANAVQPRTAALVAGRGGETGAGELLIGGKRIARLTPRPYKLSAGEQVTLNKFFAASLAMPPLPGFTNWRSAEWAGKAVSTPSDGPRSFGKLSIFMPGLGGWGPSAAFVFRMAKYSDRVVLAYQGTSQASLNTVRVATQIDGVPVPKELRGRILTLGDGANRAILSPEQASDLLIEYFALLQRNQQILGFDPLTAGATVFGHSEGSFITVMTRERLQKAGFPQAIGKLVVMAGGLGAPRDAKWIVWPAFKAYRTAVEKLGRPSNLAKVVDEYEKTIGLFGGGRENLVDLGVAAVIGPAVKRSGLSFQNVNNIRPGMRMAAMGNATFETLSKPWTFWKDDLLAGLAGRPYESSDGMVNLTWAKYGKKFLQLSVPHDHAGMIEDPFVVDEMARSLN